MVLSVVDDAELAWCHSMDGGVCMHYISAFALRLQTGRKELGGMTNLQRYLFWGHLPVDAVETMDREVLLVSCLWVVAVGDIDDVLLNVFLHDKPGTAAKAHSLALADGMKPVPFVLSDTFAGLQLYDIARLLAQVAADVVVVVDFPKEADALRVAPMGWCQMLALCYLAHFLLHHVANRK